MSFGRLTGLLCVVMCRRLLQQLSPLPSAGMLALCLALLTASCASHKSAPPPASGVQITSLPGKLAISIGGQPFTEYHFTDTPKPYLYPLLGPTGDGMTRNFPMVSPPGEEHDHPHHRSLWFGHGLVNGIDFWTEKPGAGRIVHDRFTDIRSGAERGFIRSRNQWLAPNGRVVCTDERTVTFHRGGPTKRILDFVITLHADRGDLVFGDTKEGTMAVRVAESMRLTQPAGDVNPASRIVTSKGLQDTEAWGKRAEWCDYSGLVNGQLVGVAILDHPQNPRHPTWWMVRDYGLLGANPFGQHEFEKLADEKTGDFTLPAGRSVTFRYRLILHTGTAEEAQLAGEFAKFAAESR